MNGPTLLMKKFQLTQKQEATMNATKKTTKQTNDSTKPGKAMKVVKGGRQTAERLGTEASKALKGGDIDGAFDKGMDAAMVGDKERQTITAEDVGVVPAAILAPAQEQPKQEPLPFRPLSLETQKAIADAKEQKRAGVRKGPTKGQMLPLAHDVEVLETDEHNAEGAPKLTLRRVGKRKLSPTEQAAVLKAGTQIEFVERKLIRTRKGKSKGQMVDVEVRADVVKVKSGDEEWLVACDRSMWMKAGELTKDAMVAVEAEVKE